MMHAEGTKIHVYHVSHIISSNDYDDAVIFTNIGGSEGQSVWIQSYVGHKLHHRLILLVNCERQINKF